MTDELHRLKAALREATPPPEDEAKARALALAAESFADAQGSANTARPTRNRRHGLAGFVTGAKSMFATIGLRPALLAGSSLAAIGLAIFVVLPDNRVAPDLARQDFGLTKPTAAPGLKLRLEDSVAEAAPPPIMGPMNDVSSLIVGQEMAAAPMASEPTLQARGRAVSKAIASRDADIRLPAANTERFANAEPNRLMVTADDPVSTFSIDVDTASYAFVRASLMAGRLPVGEAVRIEEMINYFPYDYAAPGDSQPFSIGVSVFQTPWNPDTQLVHIAIQGEKPALDDRPPLDLVFLIDTSGSMQDANKLPLLKQSFRLLLSRLGPDDRVAMVTYAGSSGVVLEPTEASNRQDILAALARLEAGGSTAGQAGLQQAYALAAGMQEDGRLARVLLATDGDFNVGISDPEALKDFIADKRKSGVYLSVLGFGRGNTNDALMQALAQNGNGTASYIDTLTEAQKVLVDQASGALFPIANDVKIQVEFNPAAIAEYRLIGYETRLMAREDFHNDKVDAGDIGAGHTVTALYEVTPVGSPAIRTDPLRYGASSAPASGTANELGFLQLRYKAPGEEVSRLITTPIAAGTGSATDEVMFAAAIAGFGQLLRDDKYLGDWTHADAIALASGTRGDDPFGYRAEAVTLMRLAESLSR